MIGRMLGVSNVAVMKWIKQEAKSLPEPDVPKEATLIQTDEMWHFVNGKNKIWIKDKPMIAFQGEWSPGNWVAVMLQR